MEEEKRKRVRATLTQVRALEAELEKTREELRIATRDASNVRRDLMENDVVSVTVYNEAVAERDNLRKACDRHLEDKSSLVADCNGWRQKYRDLLKNYRILEDTNSRMDEELKRERSGRSNAVKRCQELMQEINNIKNRGLWSRVLNRNY